LVLIWVNRVSRHSPDELLDGADDSIARGSREAAGRLHGALGVLVALFSRLILEFERCIHPSFPEQGEDRQRQYSRVGIGVLLGKRRRWLFGEQPHMTTEINKRALLVSASLIRVLVSPLAFVVMSS
jgi:hypothetical protein